MCYRKNFENGIVIVNPFGIQRQYDFEHIYYKLPGTQDRNHNDGKAIKHILLEPFDAYILLNSPPQETSSSISAKLSLRKFNFPPGSRFFLNGLVQGGNEDMLVDIYVALDLNGLYFPNYYFYPTWSPEIDYVTIDLNKHRQFYFNILNFCLPSEIPSIGPLSFWLILTRHNTTDLLYDPVQLFFELGY